MDPNDLNPGEQPDTALDALAAMDAGIAGEALPEAEAPQPDDVVTDEVVTDEAAADDVAVDDAKTDEATGDTAADDATKDEATQPEPDADTEKEIAGLGLKEKAAQRFRDLSAEIKELAPVRAEMERLGVKDVAGLQAIAQRAQDGQDLIQQVMDTKATPEQYGMTLDYLTAINAGDLDKAIELAQGELANLCKLAGREIPGVFDPLAEHEDLREEVEQGDITRARALEIAKQRTRDGLEQQSRQQADQRTRAEQDAQDRQTQAVEAGRTALNTLGQSLSQDPQFQAKHPQLVAAIKEITAKHPPSEWALRAETAYYRIQVATKPPVATGQAVRASTPLRPTVMPDTSDPMEALDFGIGAATG